MTEDELLDRYRQFLELDEASAAGRVSDEEYVRTLDGLLDEVSYRDLDDTWSRDLGVWDVQMEAELAQYGLTGEDLDRYMVREYGAETPENQTWARTRTVLEQQEEADGRSLQQDAAYGYSTASPQYGGGPGYAPDGMPGYGAGMTAAAGGYGQDSVETDWDNVTFSAWAEDAYGRIYDEAELEDDSWMRGELDTSIFLTAEDGDPFQRDTDDPDSYVPGYGDEGNSFDGAGPETADQNAEFRIHDAGMQDPESENEAGMESAEPASENGVEMQDLEPESDFESGPESEADSERCGYGLNASVQRAAEQQREPESVPEPESILYGPAAGPEPEAAPAVQAPEESPETEEKTVSDGGHLETSEDIQVHDIFDAMAAGTGLAAGVVTCEYIPPKEYTVEVPVSQPEPQPERGGAMRELQRQTAEIDRNAGMDRELSGPDR